MLDMEYKLKTPMGMSLTGGTKVRFHVLYKYPIDKYAAIIPTDWATTYNYRDEGLIIDDVSLCF
jgi:hypothetical protein